MKCFVNLKKNKTELILFCPKVLVNHFPMKIALRQVFFYDVDPVFTERKKNVVKKSDKPIFVRAFELLKAGNKKVFKTPYGVAYDGQKIAYSTCRLPFSGRCLFPWWCHGHYWPLPTPGQPGTG